MSRIGSWERALLDALNTNSEIWVRDILPEGFSESDYSGVMRASRLLRGRGLLTLKKIDRYGDGRRFVLVTRKTTGEAK